MSKKVNFMEMPHEPLEKHFERLPSINGREEEVELVKVAILEEISMASASDRYRKPIHIVGADVDLQIAIVKSAINKINEDIAFIELRMRMLNFRNTVYAIESEPIDDRINNIFVYDIDSFYEEHAIEYVKNNLDYSESVINLLLDGSEESTIIEGESIIRIDDYKEEDKIALVHNYISTRFGSDALEIILSTEAARKLSSVDGVLTLKQMSDIVKIACTKLICELDYSSICSSEKEENELCNERKGILDGGLKFSLSDDVMERAIEDYFSRNGSCGTETLKSKKHVSKNYTPETVLTLRNNMIQHIKGQDKAINEIVRVVKIACAGLNDGNKPIASMLFVGPTGTGKTETAKRLANSLGKRFERIDMNEYVDKISATKLSGSSAGYIGYQDGSVLSKILGKTGNCVLLLDEIEKAHSYIFDMIMQIFDNGIIVDNEGKQLNFRDTIIIMTSNAGADMLDKNTVGFNGLVQADYTDSKYGLSDCVRYDLNRTFKPEFLNRIDSIVQFNRIDKETAEDIAKIQLKKLIKKVTDFDVVVDESVYKKLACYGLDIRYGAREIQRTIDRTIKNDLADIIIYGKANGKSKIHIGTDGDKIVVHL